MLHYDNCCNVVKCVPDCSGKGNCHNHCHNSCNDPCNDPCNNQGHNPCPPNPCPPNPCPPNHCPTEPCWPSCCPCPPGITVLGFFDTYAELVAAHPVGCPGDAYLVGNRLYVWDPATCSWRDTGIVQGPAGPQGPQGIPGATGSTGATAPSIYAQQGKCRNHAAFSTLKTIKQPL